MSLLGLIGGFLIVSGTLQLKTYLQRKRWRIVKGTLDSVDLKIEPTAPAEVVGLFFKPKYNHKIQYSYHGDLYVVDLSEKQVIGESLSLRVNPERPSEAYLDIKTLLFQVFAIAIGVILVLVSIEIGTDGKK